MPDSRSTESSRPASRPASLYKTERTPSEYNHSPRADDYNYAHAHDDDGRSSRNEHHDGADEEEDESGALSVPVETLVEHLLAARRALGTIGQVLRGNELATEARALHTDAMVDAAECEFVRAGIREQVEVMVQIRRGMSRAYETGRRDFKTLIRTLDAANGQLEHTMEILRATTVATVFRPAGEEPRNLLDFVDEAGVEALQNAIKQSIAELQATQTSFDGDLLRFDTDLRTLNKAMASAPAPPPALVDAVLTDDQLDQLDQLDTASLPNPVPELLASLTQRSHTMAENLASLTRHFDLCVTAVRTTEGGLALARWKAANSVGGSPNNSGVGGEGNEQDPVSISGVIAKQEATEAGDGTHDLDPISAQERAEMMQIVLQDAAEVDAVVADIAAELHEAEEEFAAVYAHAKETEAAHDATTAAFRVVEDIGTRLPSYAAAEGEFVARWENERAVVAERLADMDELRAFYEGYANAYDTLILEAERRRTVEARIQTIWRKARDAVERLVDADQAERANFRQEVGEFLPTDLWLDMDRPPKGVELFASLIEQAPSKVATGKTMEGGVASSVLDEGSTDQGSRGVGGSSTRTVVGR
ncbi:kinase activator [Ophiostoma piceae UAMH 11346]|uniref:Autophagy-related protein 17 n=1 Tax=Ophiostoma piceae (strain UAMH 11346) TaxID=1262450 RepID=S3CC19_OPHP1|nr:kinase activator [Ophiostoma piceae UAMH 11346]